MINNYCGEGFLFFFFPQIHFKSDCELLLPISRSRAESEPVFRNWDISVSMLEAQSIALALGGKGVMQ